MTEPELPFDLYETPEPPEGLADEVAERVKQRQRAAVVHEAARRQSRKLTLAVGAVLALSIAVVVLLVVMLRDEGQRAVECPTYHAALGGPPELASRVSTEAPEFRPEAARALRNQGNLRQFTSVAERMRAELKIREAKIDRLRAGVEGPARVDERARMALADATIRNQLDAIADELAACFPADERNTPTSGLVLALAVAGEPGLGSLVEKVAVSSFAGSPPDPATVECVTQTILSLQFPSPRKGVEVLVAYALLHQPAEAEENQVVGASRPRPTPPSPAPPSPAPRALDPDTGRVAAELVSDARAFAKAGRFNEAVKLAERALQSSPNDQDALMVAVIAACNLRDGDKAAGYISQLRSAGRRGMANRICEKQLGYEPVSEDNSSQGCLDEVGCLLADEPPPCCKQYGTPRRLEERADIKNGMTQVRGRVAACGREQPGTGKVLVRIEVSPAGDVASVVVETAPTEELGNCVAKAVEHAQFRRTREGGSFTYPFVFR